MGILATQVEGGKKNKFFKWGRQLKKNKNIYILINICVLHDTAKQTLYRLISTFIYLFSLVVSNFIQLKVLIYRYSPNYLTRQCLHPMSLKTLWFSVQEMEAERYVTSIHCPDDGDRVITQTVNVFLFSLAGCQKSILIFNFARPRSGNQMETIPLSFERRYYPHPLGAPSK